MATHNGPIVGLQESRYGNNIASEFLSFFSSLERDVPLPSPFLSTFTQKERSKGEECTTY